MAIESTGFVRNIQTSTGKINKASFSDLGNSAPPTSKATGGVGGDWAPMSGRLENWVRRMRSRCQAGQRGIGDWYRYFRGPIPDQMTLCSPNAENLQRGKWCLQALFSLSPFLLSRLSGSGIGGTK